MFKIEIIGNLGADVETKSVNGKTFHTFRVAHTDRYTNATTGEVVETTTWFNCLANSLSENVLPLLTKGQRVFVRGRASLKVYSSAQYHQMMAGCDVNVSEIELCGASRAEREYIAQAQSIYKALDELGYNNVEEIPAKKGGQE